MAKAKGVRGNAEPAKKIGRSSLPPPTRRDVLSVGVLGATGRMGEAVQRLTKGSAHLALGPLVGEGDTLDALGTADVVIDFSTPRATESLAKLAAKKRLPLVIGTTGLDAAAESALKAAAKKSPVFVSSNMSIGVFVLGRLIQKAEQLLGSSFDVELVEVHHRKKVDAPSGTAILLAETLKSSRELVHGRKGRPGARASTELGMHAVRGGDVIGDHTVHFLGDGERLELTHRATHRDLFAHGALRVAAVIAGLAPGRYAMGDIIDRL